MAFPATYVTVDEYLHTSYSPDCDYVDGVVEERNLGERPHSRLQFAFLRLLDKYEDSAGIRLYPEQRVQTKSKRFRVADVCVTREASDEFVFRNPPFLCIEVLSPEDRMSRVEVRVREYLDMGVPNVWLVDPITHDAWSYSASGKQAITDGFLRTENPALEVALAELFLKAERR